jgi:glycosyltransferase involved in cell wall biosynthesis
MKLLFITGSNTDPASRFRIFALLPYLKSKGHDIEVFTPSPDYTWRIKKKNRYIFWTRVYITQLSRFFSYLLCFKNLYKYDLVYINRTLLSHSKFLESIFFKLSNRIIFDFDDAIYYPNKHQRVGNYIRNATWVTPGNATLSEFAKIYNKNLTIIPTVVDTSVYTLSERKTENIKVKIGWSGSWDSMAVSFPFLEKILIELNNNCQFKLIVISNNAPNFYWLKKIDWEFIKWEEENEVEKLKEIDIGLMPLEDKPFEKGKCGLKLLQYMAIGIPTVASGVGVNSDIILHGKTGFVANKHEDWLKYLSKLINDTVLCEKMGRLGRERVIENYSIEYVLPTILDVFSKVTKLNH